MIITIDGPAASGKSTVAKKLAEYLNFYYINSGLFYRSFAYICVKKLKMSFDTLSNYDFAEVFPIDLELFSYEYINNQVIIKYKGNEITKFLKEPEIDRSSAIIAKNLTVRETVFHLQRHLAQIYNDLVADGRDCGTVVFPHAEYKFFLTASLEVRAQRWLKDKLKQNEYFTLDQAIGFIKDRDASDMHREISPLKPAPNSIIIDNSDLDIEKTANVILSKIKI